MSTSLDPGKIRRVLIVRLSAVGDVLHALPVLRALKRWRKEIEVDWLVEDRFASLLKNMEDIARLIEVPRRQWQAGRRRKGVLSDAFQMRRILRRRQYDVSIDLQGLTKSGLWPWLAGVPVRIGYGDEDGRELNRWLTNIRVVPDSRLKHVVDRSLALLEPLGIVEPEADLSIPIDEAAASKIDSIYRARGWHERRLALLQPGAGWQTKRWPPEFYGRVADWLIHERDYAVAVLWGPGEEDLAQAVLGSMNKKGALAPPTDLPELIELIRRGSLFIGGDTGPMHLAAAMSVPTVAIFGASDPRRNGPYGEGHRVVYSDEECRPCWKTRCDRLTCLQQLKPEKVLEAIASYLQDK